MAVEINAHGFRDDAFSDESTGSRLVVLGDSLVFGSGVHQADRFTEQLEASAWGRGRNIEVLNLGVNSYTFAHYLKLARMDYLQLRPDRVLVGFTLNDILEKHEARPTRLYGKVKSSAGPSRRDEGRSFRSAMGATYAGRFVHALKAYLELADEDEEQKEPYHTKWMRSVVRRWRRDADRQRLFAEIAAFQELMQEKGIPYRFVVFPEQNTLLDAEKFAYPRTALTEFLESRQIDYCDAYPAFAGFDGEISELFLAGDSVHYAPRGHRLISEVPVDCYQRGG